MSSARRVEISPNNRAGCQNTECKKEGIKISKGTLRFGTFVTILDHQGWKWKHWGCVTPKQILNLRDTIDGDFDQLDGFDEIPEDVQAKIKKAVENGHVDDKDWTGDVEMNRAGKNGYRTPESKKRLKAEKAEHDNAAEEDASPSGPTSKKRSHVKEDPEGRVADDGSPPPKKAKATKKPKKVKTGAAEEESGDDARSKKKSRKKASKPKNEAFQTTAIKNESSDHEIEPSHSVKKTRLPRKAAATSKIKAEDSDADGLDDVSGLEKAKVAEENDERPELEARLDEKATSPKRDRKRPAKKVKNSKSSGADPEGVSKAMKQMANEVRAEKPKRISGRATRSNPTDRK